MVLRPNDYVFTYHPCKKREIDVPVMREKTSIFQDYVIFPFIHEPIHFEAHDTLEGNVWLYPKHSTRIGPTILEVGIISHEKANVKATDQEGYLEITIGRQVFKLHENTYRPQHAAAKFPD